MKQATSLALSLTLKTGAICSSETSVDFRRTTRRYIPEPEFFITTAVRTSDPTISLMVLFSLKLYKDRFSEKKFISLISIPVRVPALMCVYEREMFNHVQTV
jgi:hypothetical protein